MTNDEESVPATEAVPAPADRLAALGPLAPDDFFRITIEGAASVLRDATNPLRLNLFSTAIRMLFEHIMGTLAPDADVEACPWYAPVDGQDKPVRAQRIQYWLQGGLSDDYLGSELGLVPDALRKRLLKAFNNLSKHVHGRANTLVRDPGEQETEAEGTVSVTLQFGSNSDLRRGDGAELDDSFPFECLFDVPLDDPRDLSRAEVVSGVDTSSWYGDDWRDDGREIDVDVSAIPGVDLDAWLRGKGDDYRPDF